MIWIMDYGYNNKRTYCWIEQTDKNFNNQERNFHLNQNQIKNILELDTDLWTGK